MRSACILILACLFPFAGCTEKPKPSTAELLVGTWVGQSGTLVDFKMDGSAVLNGDVYKLAYKLSQDQQTIDIVSASDGIPVLSWQVVSIDAAELHIIYNGGQYIYHRKDSRATK